MKNDPKKGGKEWPMHVHHSNERSTGFEMIIHWLEHVLIFLWALRSFAKKRRLFQK